MAKNVQPNLEKKFLELLVKKGNSIPTIAEKLRIDIEKAYDLNEELELEIMDLKVKEYDKVVQKYGLGPLNQFKYSAELYKRLKAELDKRDFTGLPTDKLYLILMDVQEKINSSIDSLYDSEDFDDEYFDDFEEDLDTIK